MKIGHRLEQIVEIIKRPYFRIWDCCCDHGLLGMALLDKRVAHEVYFIDVLEKQINRLRQKLSRFFRKTDYQWQIYCKDLNQVVIPEQGDQLVIIAGVGSDKTVQFIESLKRKSLADTFDLIVCSVHGNYHVRRALIDFGYRLLDECIVEENGRFYEIIYVSHNADEVVSPVGDKMWDWSNPQHITYWHKTIQHYQKKALGNKYQFLPIINAYQDLRDDENEY
jgi:tRNA (adenine22-N1)-methyltransferase